MAINLPQVPFKLTAQDMGGYDMASALEKGINLGFLPREKKATLQSQLLKNIEQEIINKNKQQDFDTIFASRGASTRASNLASKLHELELNNPGLLGSGLMKDIAIYKMMKDRGMIPDQMQQSPSSMEYAPDTTMADTTAAMQQKTPQEVPDRMQRMLANTLMQQFGQQQLKQVPNTTDLTRSIHDYIQPVVSPEQDLYTRAINAQIEKASGRSSALGKGGVKQQNLNAFVQAVDEAYPDLSPEQKSDIVDAHLDGNETLPDGTPVPPMTGKVRQAYENVISGNAPVALKNQYAQMDILVNDMNQFPIDDIAQFTGIGGKARIAAEKAKMAAGLPAVDQKARDYLVALDQSIITMDQMRSTWKTSVQPKYVRETLGKLANPNDSIYNDEKLVKQAWKRTLEVMNRNRDIMKYKLQHGVTADLPKELTSESNADANSGKKMAQMLDPDGMPFEIPEENVEKAIALHPGTRRA